MTATVTRGSPAPGNTGPGSAGAGLTARRAAGRRRLGFPRASTTPGKVRLIRAGRREATSWFAVNRQAQKPDQAHDYGAEAQLVIGQGPGSAGTLFGRLETDLDAAIRADQAVFADSAAAGSGAFTGLVAGVAVLALAMAAGCAWGLSRRLAEYR
jgi:hypothetical protein